MVADSNHLGHENPLTSWPCSVMMHAHTHTVKRVAMQDLMERFFPLDVDSNRERGTAHLKPSLQLILSGEATTQRLVCEVLLHQLFYILCSLSSGKLLPATQDLLQTLLCSLRIPFSTSRTHRSHSMQNFLVPFLKQFRDEDVACRAWLKGDTKFNYIR